MQYWHRVLLFVLLYLFAWESDKPTFALLVRVSAVSITLQAVLPLR